MTHRIQTQHHRKPKSKGGKKNPSNIVMVDAIKHDAWHRLFQNMSPYEIALAINQTWIDPQFYFVVARRVFNEL